MHYCLSCDCAQFGGQTCWCCGGKALVVSRPSYWPTGFPHASGSQHVIWREIVK